MLFTFGVPFVAAYMMHQWWAAAGFSFLNITVLWAVNYLAVEIERPFGHDYNDLPLADEIHRMNAMLLHLIKPAVHFTPSYSGLLSSATLNETEDLSIVMARADKASANTSWLEPPRLAPAYTESPVSKILVQPVASEPERQPSHSQKATGQLASTAPEMGLPG